MELKFLIEQVLLEQELCYIAEQAELIAEDLNNLKDFANEADSEAVEAKNIQRQTREVIDVSQLQALRLQLMEFLQNTLRQRFDDKSLDQYIDLILFNPNKVVGPRGERLFDPNENMRGLRYLKTDFIGGL
jgi:hypothetical protein